ncbi:MAG: tetratricopeptide repeat protein [Spirochaetes bacterium]|nr:tetratricopeptide repeat protein [Spirochaetota bacterium]MCK5266923.1 tetratricopeptide repeat protein [Spirochaetota bacterium]
MNFSNPVFIPLGLIIATILFLIIKMLFFRNRFGLAAELIKGGKIEEALNILLKEESKGHPSPKLHYLLGECYYRFEVYEKSLSEYVKLIKLGKFDGMIKEITVREKIASIYLKYNRLEDAQRELLLILRKVPENVKYLFIVAKIYYERNFSEDAFNYFEQVLKAEPEHSEALYYFGMILYNRKALNESLEYFKRSADADSSNKKPHYYIGMIMYQQKNYDMAIKEFDTAIYDQEFRAKAQVQKGIAQLDKNDVTQAMISLQRAVEYSKDTDIQALLYSRYYLGNCYLVTKDIQGAVDQWMEIQKIKPNFLDVEQKLQSFKEYVIDDFIMDLRISNNDAFLETCKDLITYGLNLVIQKFDLPNSEMAEFYAMEGESKWKSKIRTKFYIRVYRIDDKIGENILREIIETSKKASAHKAMCIATSDYTNYAMNYAQSRNIEMLSKEKLSELLKKAYMDKKQEKENQS